MTTRYSDKYLWPLQSDEVFRPVPTNIHRDGTQLFASNYGRLAYFIDDKPVFIRTSVGETGYERYCGGNVARLVAYAWHGDPGSYQGKNGKMLTYQVNHKDKNRMNSRPDNLEWVTVAENAAHARSFKTQKRLKKPSTRGQTLAELIQE